MSLLPDGRLSLCPLPERQRRTAGTHAACPAGHRGFVSSQPCASGFPYRVSRLLIESGSHPRSRLGVVAVWKVLGPELSVC